MLEMRSLSEPGANFWEPCAQVLIATSQNPGHKFWEVCRTVHFAGKVAIWAPRPNFSEPWGEVLRGWGRTSEKALGGGAIQEFRIEAQHPSTPPTSQYLWVQLVPLWMGDRGQPRISKKRFLRIGPKTPSQNLLPLRFTLKDSANSTWHQVRGTKH